MNKYGWLIRHRKYLVTKDVSLENYHFGAIGHEYGAIERHHFAAGTELTVEYFFLIPYDETYFYVFKDDNGVEYKGSFREIPVDEIQKFELIKED